MTTTATNLQFGYSDDVSSKTSVSAIDVIQQFRDEYRKKTNHLEKGPAPLRYYDQRTIDEVKATALSYKTKRANKSTRLSVSNSSLREDPIADHIDEAKATALSYKTKGANGSTRPSVSNSSLTEDPIAFSRRFDQDTSIPEKSLEHDPIALGRIGQDATEKAIPASAQSQIAVDEGKSVVSSLGTGKLSYTSADIEKDVNSFLLKRKSEIPSKVNVASSINFPQSLQKRREESGLTTKISADYSPNSIYKATVDISGIGLMYSSLTTDASSCRSRYTQKNDRYAMPSNPAPKNKADAQVEKKVEKEEISNNLLATLWESMKVVEEKALEIEEKILSATGIEEEPSTEHFLDVMREIIADAPSVTASAGERGVHSEICHENRSKYLVEKFRDSVKLVGERAATTAASTAASANDTYVHTKIAQEDQTKYLVKKFRESVKLVGEKAAKMEEKILIATGIEEQLIREESKDDEEFLEFMKEAMDEMVEAQEESIIAAADMFENASEDVLHKVNNACPFVGASLTLIGIKARDLCIELSDKMDQGIESFYEVHGV
eukprot:CAMPEP_0194207166 /NCGR_PEP_ID=MMETSP0156-20130528/5999_1 /TAXON_ID=33649 /ORGANISM="Thalassionema nitzschioides, Strain L26-B" /LENGTH=551 /DNA_ID=CAMNT_0038933879 /DNA_START=50 /DNA_END=1705 /DNA_ORIENTATION=+